MKYSLDPTGDIRILDDRGRTHFARASHRRRRGPGVVSALCARGWGHDEVHLSIRTLPERLRSRRSGLVDIISCIECKDALKRKLHEQDAVRVPIAMTDFAREYVLEKHHGTMRFSDVLWKHGDNALINGDCREVLRCVPVESVDMFMTSPPYQVGMDYEKGVKFGEWADLLRETAAAMWYACKPGGYAVVNFGPSTKHERATESVIADAFSDAGWALQARRVWKKIFTRLHAPAYTRQGPWPLGEYENVWAWWKPGAGKECINWDVSAHSVWEVPADQYTDKEHKASFPVGLPLQAMQAYVRSGSVICDPFVGVGTTIIAARQYGCSCIGIELDEGFCVTAVDRLSREFAMPSEPPESGAIQTNIYDHMESGDAEEGSGGSQAEEEDEAPAQEVEEGERSQAEGEAAT